jgi:hypothetical protein
VGEKQIVFWGRGPDGLSGCLQESLFASWSFGFTRCLDRGIGFLFRGQLSGSYAKKSPHGGVCVRGFWTFVIFP